MKLQIFAVRDVATDQFGTPMFLVSSGQAIRSFGDEVNRSSAENQLYQHPDDFELFALGEYDTATAVFSTVPPAQVATGRQLKVRS